MYMINLFNPRVLVNADTHDINKYVVNTVYDILKINDNKLIGYTAEMFKQTPVVKLNVQDSAELAGSTGDFARNLKKAILAAISKKLYLTGSEHAILLNDVCTHVGFIEQPIHVLTDKNEYCFGYLTLRFTDEPNGIEVSVEDNDKNDLISETLAVYLVPKDSLYW